MNRENRRRQAAKKRAHAKARKRERALEKAMGVQRFDVLSALRMFEAELPKAMARAFDDLIINGR